MLLPTLYAKGCQTLDTSIILEFKVSSYIPEISVKQIQNENHCLLSDMRLSIYCLMSSFV